MAALKVKLRIFVGMVYINLMLSCFLVLVVIGLMLLNDEMVEYLHQIANRFDAEQAGLTKMALIGYTVLAWLMLWVYNLVTIYWVGFDRIVNTVLPCFFIIELIYSAFMFITGLVIYLILSKVSPETNRPISISVMSTGLLLLVAGLAGLVSHRKGFIKVTATALAAITCSNLAIMFLGLLTAFGTGLVD